MKYFVISILMLLMSSVCGVTYSHDLKLDQNGCHNDGRYGKYHCHEGEHAGESFVSVNEYPDYRPETIKLSQMTLVKRTKAGICIGPESVLYKKQKKYWVYPSMEACLQDGGRGELIGMVN